MKPLSNQALRMLPFLFVLVVMGAGSSIVFAADDQQDAQQERSVSGGTSGGTTQPGSSDVKGRGLQRFAPRTGVGPTGPPIVTAPEAVGFKCSPHTGRCNCSGTTDCKFMKQTIGASCGPTTCTGSGTTQACTCTINGF